MTEAAESIIVPAARGKILLLGLGAVLFVIAGVFLVTTDESSLSSPLVRFLGLACVVLFGLASIYLFQRLTSRRPAVEITAQGILDNSSAISVGLLSWDEIEEIVPVEFMGQPMLAIVPRDAGAVLARQPKWKRALLRANARIGAALINIPGNMLPISVEELYEEIVRRYGERWRDDS
jgi:hypothetical protein